VTAVTEPPSLPGPDPERSLGAASPIDAHEKTARCQRGGDREPFRIGRDLAPVGLAVARAHTIVGNTDLERNR
jgi:hypothetical protein